MMAGQYTRTLMVAVWAVLTIGRGTAEDFLYVVATPTDGRSEIHWVPTNNPLSARVLVEELGERPPFIYRYKDELWWSERNALFQGDLVGQQANKIALSSTLPRAMVRQGEVIYWVDGGGLWSWNLLEREQRNLSSMTFDDGVVVHGGRLYFTGLLSVNSMRTDGSDIRIDASMSGFDPGLFGIFGATGFASHGDRMVWGSGNTLWTMSFRTHEVAVLAFDLPAVIESVTLTEQAVYWIGDGQVWRWREGHEEHDSIYQLGETRMESISAVSAIPHPVEMTEQNRISVQGDIGEHYQLLYSQDLESWSPDFVETSPQTLRDRLEYLHPQTSVSEQPLTWSIEVSVQQAYFRALQYKP